MKFMDLELTAVSGIKNKKTVTAAVAVLILLIVAVIAVITSHKKDTAFTDSSLGMGTVITQTVYAENETDADAVMTDVNKLINELDFKYLSWRTAGSEIYTLNENGSATISETTAECLRTCLAVSESCGGLFDVTVGDLSALWGIGTEDARVPTEIEIATVLPLIDFNRVTINGTTASIGENQKVDLGAVGKGLACDEIRKHLVKTETPCAVISVGGSVLLYGTNPTSEDGSFRVGVRNPFGAADEFAGILTLGEGCISTSGDYEKVLIENGVTYHHILNPKTGYPAKSDLTAVTVVSDSGVLSDALSTACFILGYSDEALSLLSDYNSEAVFITKDKKVYITDGLKTKLTLTDDSFVLA